jgi:hypothetical protein
MTAPWKAHCPACATPSRLVAAMDRYVHLDGTVNRSCWLAITRGDVVPDRTATAPPAAPRRVHHDRKGTPS